VALLRKETCHSRPPMHLCHLVRLSVRQRECVSLSLSLVCVSLVCVSLVCLSLMSLSLSCVSLVCVSLSRVCLLWVSLSCVSLSRVSLVCLSLSVCLSLVCVCVVCVSLVRVRERECHTVSSGLFKWTREVGGWGRVPFSRNLMSPTPRRKWYLTTGRRFH